VMRFLLLGGSRYYCELSSCCYWGFISDFATRLRTGGVYKCVSRSDLSHITLVIFALFPKLINFFFLNYLWPDTS